MNAMSSTLCNLLKNIAEIEPEKLLIGSNGSWYSAAQVYENITAAAGAFSRLGIKKGCIIAIRMDRSENTLFCLFALRMLGALAVLTDPHNDPHSSIDGCEAEIAVDGYISKNADGNFDLTFKDTAYCLTPEGLFAPGECSFEAETDNSLPGYIIFTSGSTGKTKAVTVCDRNLIANLVDSAPFGCYSREDIALGALPLDHVFGLVLAAGVFVLGYAMYLTNATDIPSLIETVAEQKITRMNGVPSLYLAIAEKADSCSISTLRAGFIGGAPSSVQQFEYIEETLGMTLVPVYGMSECIGISCGDYRLPREQRYGNVGRVYPMVNVRLVDFEGKDVRPGEAGEILVNGAARMLGYWPNLLPAEEYLSTGDLGRIDENGFLHIEGRIKEIIIRNGKNIAPAHIESALLSLPGVTDAAVVGLPHKKLGEAPYAMVVGTVDSEALKAILPKNELPEGIMSVEALPRLASGKADKLKIRKMLESLRRD